MIFFIFLNYYEVQEHYEFNNHKGMIIKVHMKNYLTIIIFICFSPCMCFFVTHGGRNGMVMWVDDLYVSKIQDFTNSYASNFTHLFPLSLLFYTFLLRNPFSLFLHLILHIFSPFFVNESYLWNYRADFFCCKLCVWWIAREFWMVIWIVYKIDYHRIDC